MAMEQAGDATTRGLAHLEAGELGEALDCLRTAMEAAPLPPVAAALRRLAQEALRCGMEAPQDSNQAVAAYGHCVAAYLLIGNTIDDPTDREILRVACGNLGTHHHRHGRYREAIAYYRDVLLLDPADIGAVINLSDILVRVERAWEAVPILREALAREPEIRSLHANLVCALYENGDVAGAIEAAKQAGQRFPDMRFQHRAVFYRYRRGGRMITA